MNSAIITEGPTDFVIIQYYMQKVCLWNDFQESSFRDDIKKVKARELKKKNNVLTILSAGGCSKISKQLDSFLRKNSFSSDNKDSLSKIVIISDNDDESSISEMENSVTDVIQKYSLDKTVKLQNRQWQSIRMYNGISEELTVDILLMLIPFEEHGAIETFLLNAISEKDDYDKTIIEKGNNFVETIDFEERYLKHRRDKTKAKMDVYFSVRTSAEQFSERQNILKNIAWENYEKIQKCFSELRKL